MASIPSTRRSIHDSSAAIGLPSAVAGEGPRARTQSLARRTPATPEPPRRVRSRRATSCRTSRVLLGRVRTSLGHGVCFVVLTRRCFARSKRATPGRALPSKAISGEAALGVFGAQFRRFQLNIHFRPNYGTRLRRLHTPSRTPTKDGGVASAATGRRSVASAPSGGPRRVHHPSVSRVRAFLRVARARRALAHLLGRHRRSRLDARQPARRAVRGDGARRVRRAEQLGDVHPDHDRRLRGVARGLPSGVPRRGSRDGPELERFRGMVRARRRRARRAAVDAHR